MDEVELTLLQTCHELARGMVRLEVEAQRLKLSRRPDRLIRDVNAQRRAVQVHRSRLLRQLWEARHEALRQARMQVPVPVHSG